MKAISNLPEWKKYYGIFCGWDSDTSFESDTDDEIDTTEIEEEDWMEYIKRITDEAVIRWKMQRFDVGSRRTKE